MVEAALGIEGDDILYVGDHIYTDAALAKINFRWRTALIVSSPPKGCVWSLSCGCCGNRSLALGLAGQLGCHPGVRDPT